MQEHGAEQLFLRADCNIPISKDVRIIAVYAIPKYTLAFGTRREALQAIVDLALARTQGEVGRAVQSPATQTYEINRHMHLRHAYVSVFVCSDDTVVDEHKHWMQAAGQSEHAWFVASLLNLPQYQEALQQHKRGPVNSQPKKVAKIQPKAKRSEELKRMLQAPEEESVCPDAASSSDCGRLPLQALQLDSSIQNPGTISASAKSTSAQQELADEGVPQGHVAVNTSVCLARTWKMAGGHSAGSAFKQTVSSAADTTQITSAPWGGSTDRFLKTKGKSSNGLAPSEKLSNANSPTRTLRSL